MPLRLQGARLTAYELVHDKLMPASLITDSAAASLMAAGAPCCQPTSGRRTACKHWDCRSDGLAACDFYTRHERLHASHRASGLRAQKSEGSI